MLFNKKPEEEVMHDFSTGKRTSNGTVATVESITSAQRKINNSAPTRSVIDAWLTITGNLQSEGEVQVDGQINGDIRCAHLIVGRDATVNGNITAEEVVVRGKVTGVIRANRVDSPGQRPRFERDLPQEALHRGRRLLRRHVSHQGRPAQR